jgi:hypothetical protein
LKKKVWDWGKANEISAIAFDFAPAFGARF